MTTADASPAVTPYQRVYDYAEAFELEQWAAASEHAWARLDSIAAEHQRGEYGWERARELIDETRAEIGLVVP